MNHGVAVKAGVTQIAITRSEIRPQCGKGAVVVRPDHHILIGGRLCILGGGARVVEQLHVRPDRDVIPTVEPERRHAPAHVVVIETALPPGRVRRRARDQRFEGRRRLAQIRQHLADGQVTDLARPLHLRLLGVQIVVADDARPLFLIQARGNLCTLRIVDAIQPDEEQVARHAAGVPVALFLEATDLADPGRRRLRHHGGVSGMVLRRQGQLPFSRRRTAQGADLTVRPGLRRDPCQ
ncbi:hypothetical protein D3C72_1162560 [compost metagenome]